MQFLPLPIRSYRETERGDMVALLLGDYWPEKVCEHWDYLDRRERGGGQTEIMGTKTLGDLKPSHKASEGQMKPFLTSLCGIKSQRRLCRKRHTK